MKRLSSSKRIAVGAVIAALNVICLYAGTAIPVINVIGWFLSSAWLYVLVCEHEYAAAWIVYGASAVLAFFLLPDKLPALGYLIVWGHYGIFRQMIDLHVASKAGRIALKILCLDFFALLGLVLARVLFGDVTFPFLGRFPLFLVILGAQIVFELFELLYRLFAKIYFFRFRKHIINK